MSCFFGLLNFFFDALFGLANGDFWMVKELPTKLLKNFPDLLLVKS